jgi:hypothetical protein
MEGMQALVEQRLSMLHPLIQHILNRRRRDPLLLRIVRSLFLQRIRRSPRMCSITTLATKESCSTTTSLLLRILRIMEVWREISVKPLKKRECIMGTLRIKDILNSQLIT